MSELGFKELCGAFDVELEVVQARRRAVSKVSETVEELENLGFAPHVKCSKNDGSAGMVMLMLDLGADASFRSEPAEDVDQSGRDVTVNFEIGVGEGFGITVPAEPLAKVPPAEPEPEQVDVERADQAVAAALGDASPVPDKKPGKPKKKPDLVTGPIKGEERELILSMFADGMTPSHVAKQLGRKTKQLANFKQNNGAAILQAKQQREAPETEPVEQSEPAKMPVLADTLSGPEREINIHLNAVGYVDGWTPERDLQMAEGLGRGDGAGVVARYLDLRKDQVVTRWLTINEDVGSIDHQRRLVRVLRLRVRPNSLKAAE